MSDKRNKITEEQQNLYDRLSEWVQEYQNGDQNAFNNIYNATFQHVLHM